MMHAEILSAAIAKAQANGWEEYGTDKDAVHYLLKYEEAPDTYTWLFSHDFARALWGSGETIPSQQVPDTGILPMNKGIIAAWITTLCLLSSKWWATW